MPIQEREKPELPAPEKPILITEKPEGRIDREVETLLEKVEKDDVQLTQPVTDDLTGQVLVTAPSAKKQKITLPIDRRKLLYGLKQSIDTAIRWLSELCLKLIKKDPTKVKFKKNE